MKLELPAAHLEYVVNHVFLPPKLPQDSDYDTAVKDHALLTLVLDAAKEYQGKLAGKVESSRWEPMMKMLEVIRKSTDRGGISSNLIADSIDGMTSGGQFITLVSSNA
jgi:hypothetical protein